MRTTTKATLRTALVCALVLPACSDDNPPVQTPDMSLPDIAVDQALPDWAQPDQPRPDQMQPDQMQPAPPAARTASMAPA